MTDDAPRDPFPEDPGEDPRDHDPRHEDSRDRAQAVDDAHAHGPLSPEEREDALSDLEDLEIFRVLLESNGVRGVVVECVNCGEPHYVGWDLMRANLRHLLDVGLTQVHEPPYDPDPHDYVTWDYARGYADGVIRASDVPEG